MAIPKCKITKYLILIHHVVDDNYGIMMGQYFLFLSLLNEVVTFYVCDAFAKISITLFKKTSLKCVRIME